MFSNIKTKFKEKPTLFYALSICATWAGIGSLMNGVTMTQTYGIIPSIIWVLGNTIACIVFGLVAMKLPKVREVFGSSIMKWICGIMCVFQAWLSMNGMQTVFSDTILGAKFGIYLAYGLAIFFLIILLKFGMIRNVLTDGAGWIVVYLLAVFVTAAAAVYSGGAFNHIPMIADQNSMHQGIMKAVLLLPGPFTYPYFFEILHYNEKNGDGTKCIDVKKAFTLGGIFFGISPLKLRVMDYMGTGQGGRVDARSTPVRHTFLSVSQISWRNELSDILQEGIQRWYSDDWSPDLRESHETPGGLEDQLQSHFSGRRILPHL